MTPGELIAFEDDIADEFARGNIRSPVHLSGGNEEQLIEIFGDIGPGDWVLSGWRSHYHCLLKGVPLDKLKAEILKGRSVALQFPEYKVRCSGICGGIAAWAIGIAKGSGDRVHVFLGDMSARMGVVHEAQMYAAGHSLPVRWYVEDNEKSVATPTDKAWGKFRIPTTYTYPYELTRPHCGVGKWVKL